LVSQFNNTQLLYIEDLTGLNLKYCYTNLRKFYFIVIYHSFYLKNQPTQAQLLIF
jgi:hypothetical protein